MELKEENVDKRSEKKNLTLKHWKISPRCEEKYMKET